MTLDHSLRQLPQKLSSYQMLARPAMPPPLPKAAQMGLAHVEHHRRDSTWRRWAPGCLATPVPWRCVCTGPVPPFMLVQLVQGHHDATARKRAAGCCCLLRPAPARRVKVGVDVPFRCGSIRWKKRVAYWAVTCHMLLSTQRPGPSRGDGMHEEGWGYRCAAGERPQRVSMLLFVNSCSKL